MADTTLLELLSVEQVATPLECSPATVEELARTGELPGIKIGRSWVFPRTALMSALNQKAIRDAEARQREKTKGAAVAVTREKRNAAPALPTLRSA